MCQLKSGIILKDRIFIGPTDSHTEMLEELGIEDTAANAKRLFVRAELYPKDNDVFTPVEQWIYHVDQDILPDWYVPDYDKSRFVSAVRDWAGSHIFDKIPGLTIAGPGIYFLRDCKDATLWDNSTATLWDNSTATLRGHSTATLRDNSTATLRGNSTATLWDNSTATLWDNSTATLWDNRTGIIPTYQGGDIKNYQLQDNATIKECKTQTIYQSGDWKYIKITKDGRND